MKIDALSEMINVVCVLNVQNNHSGPAYDETWVDKLYNGLRRNLHINFEFICFSNTKTKYKTVPLITESQGYWNKIEIFRKDIVAGPTLYLDLDVVICKDITDTIVRLPQNKFLMVQEPYQGIHNSSIMFWNGDYSYLYNKYVDNKQAIINEYLDITRSGWLGDQAYIGENVSHNLLTEYVAENFIGWKHHKINVALHDPSIMIFTGGQKPSNNLTMPCVRDHWI